MHDLYRITAAAQELRDALKAVGRLVRLNEISGQNWRAATTRQEYAVREWRSVLQTTGSAQRSNRLLSRVLEAGDRKAHQPREYQKLQMAYAHLDDAVSYNFAAAQLEEASHLLHAVHPQGPAYATGSALRACAIGMSEVERAGLDPAVQSGLRMLDFMTESSGLGDADPLDAWVSNPSACEPDQVGKLSALINELSTWFTVHTE